MGVESDTFWSNAGVVFRWTVSAFAAISKLSGNSGVVDTWEHGWM
jgi:hypothetical protein